MGFMQQPTESKPVALVTGASTGFGRVTVETLARAGYRTYAGVRDIAGRNSAIAKELTGLGIEPVELDVTSDASVDAAAKRVLGEAGRVDLLVNNAGQAFFGVVESFTPKKVQAQFDVNVFGVLRVNRAFLPQMRKNHAGHVIYVSSIAGRFISPFMGIYTASKHALEALAEASAYELKPFGVDVTIIEPGAYATNIFNVTVLHDDDATNASYGELGGKAKEIGSNFGAVAGDPQEVADAILDVARREAGKRPLRHVVGPESPALAVNDALAPIQKSVLEWFGAGALAPEVTHESSPVAALSS